MTCHPPANLRVNLGVNLHPSRPSAIPTHWAMPRNTGNSLAVPPIRQNPIVIQNGARCRGAAPWHNFQEKFAAVRLQ